MKYFGTELNQAGHYFWELDGEHLISKGLSFPQGNGIPSNKWSEFPFDPESMPKREKGESMQKGDVKYYRENGYTICAIEGSCSDKRWGSKSIFFINEKLLFWELAIKIVSIPIARKIIKQMPFEVRWGLEKQYIDKIEALMV
jgi:hypothetical protein